MSFRREKFVPRGGPDGGDGGKGGDVIIVADEGLTTLAHLRHRRVYKAESGRPGEGGHRRGANGVDLTVKVPVGTVVTALDAELRWDLDAPGAAIIVAKGGDGGRGNARFSNSVRQAPSFAERGMPGEEFDLRLELKLLADVGLIGLPNAGKSTLLRAVSRAMPDVGDFPFTTLEPVLGVVDLGMDAFVMADLPGLIEGAHAGAGLGHQFLRHVERTRVLVHLLDASAPDPIEDYETVRRELELYDELLLERPEIVVLNKIDLPDAQERLPELREHFIGADVLAISGATTEGTQELVQRLQQRLSELATEARAAVPEKPPVPVLRPEPRDRLDLQVEDGVFVVRGRRAEEDAMKLAEGGWDAMDELQQRLRRMGLERLMRRAGAKAGDIVRVGDVEFEWYG